MKAAATDRKIDSIVIGDLYDTMVKPLVPFAVRGFIWYQGESNLVCGDTAIYAHKMKALIASWRSAWADPALPVYYVQLAPHSYSIRKLKKPSDKLLTPEALPLFWEAQTEALKISNTGMAVITDTVTEYADVHPTNKQDVGARLARLALARTYGQKHVDDSGPIFIKSDILENQVELEFSNAQGLTSRDGKPLTFFSLAGEDRVFVPAEATIKGSKVIVKALGVSKPVAVRFAWNECANPNLVNAARLPVRTFRTDHWPVEAIRTEDSR
ncbi:MAG: hypothetical protein H8M99_09895 [Gloeobacteraceae cyanobacterium ES-bin-144]|nr:hypothetical protein [Verrucomicrobiales bacterium]